ncbi:MAG: hypothetical protein OXI41_01465 [Chloroflexota bacterium]|nr:hypothetical protein [Chloroflexota bacterium]MDE2895755.1 hypothetical protein [Chloroflexota bacterium]
MVLRRIAEAIDRRPNTYRIRRSILQIAAEDFTTQLPRKKGRSGNWGVSGWDLSNLAHPAFWSMALLSQRRQRFAMTLIGQVHQDQAAVQPYVQEKRATEQVLHGLQGVDPDSLVGFVDAAVMMFQPPGSSGAPLIPHDQATEILRLALLRGAMVGELRPDEVRAAWNQAHPDQLNQHGEEVAWKKAQGRAEMLLESWTQTRRGQGRRLI